MAEIPLEIIISSFTILVLITATILSFYRFLQVKYKQFLYIALNWCGIAVWLILTVVSTCIKFDLVVPGINTLDTEVGIFSNLPILSDFLDFFGINIVIFSSPVMLSHFLGLIGLFSLLPTALFLIILVDSINRTSIDPIKTGILGLISTTVIIAALAPGQGPKDISPYTYFASVMLQFLWAFLWIYYALKLYINSPENLQRFALVILVGTILAGAIPVFNTATQLIQAGLGINELSFAIGILLMAGTLLYQPGMLFILPYKTSRLGVFNEKGVPLFSHQWISREDDPTSEIVFTEMKEGISTILTESLKQANVREIHLDEAILIIERHKNFSFVLLTAKTSRSLTTALNTFSVKFVTKFEELLAKSVVIDPKDHATASTIVAECFPFLPS
ncbi:MAG: hypothetical protein JSW11_08010 [Candidatus Heimdallarchaeota archaeon]|nr:MAG: hypothetical protein JSW11_08010 [Candidatus Heimdallarchaeota archaeon]